MKVCHFLSYDCGLGLFKHTAQLVTHLQSGAVCESEGVWAKMSHSHSGKQ